MLLLTDKWAFSGSCVQSSSFLLPKRSLLAWGGSRQGSTDHFDYTSGDLLLCTAFILVFDPCGHQKSPDSLFIHFGHLLNELVHLDRRACTKGLKHFFEYLGLVFVFDGTLEQVHDQLDIELSHREKRQDKIIRRLQTFME